MKDWVSTHPLDEKRIQYLRQFMKENRYSLKPVLKKGVLWTDIRASCN
jgi:hypothetical protein